MDFDEARKSMWASADFTEAMRQIYPDPIRRQQFKDWLRARRENFAPKILTDPDKFKTDIDNAHFFNETFLDTMVRSTGAKQRLWVPIGRDEHFRYRLTVEPHGLEATDVDDEENLVNLAPVFPRCVLAFQSPGKAAEKSAEKPAFIFFQLGELEYTPNTDTDIDTIATHRGWDETGFNVVARIGSDGKMGGIFIVYNMDETRTDRDLKEIWGLLPTPLGSDFDDEERRFFCARLSNSLGELGDDYRLNWEEDSIFGRELANLVRVRRN
ncbi:hypothetical protein B0T25DRAFT_267976 [Lasiosphaeria hispida]|uniref:Uncharacterized protein n=1 Tax=Lasiosphaeria hispida TaxID=260671 RepID=A0AAJ0MAD9_9PEZI|nr:hypothetical protein B0T25DRAFT_267976 [Lasiosphaeria hispida]